MLDTIHTVCLLNNSILLCMAGCFQLRQAPGKQDACLGLVAYTRQSMSTEICIYTTALGGPNLGTG